MIKNSKQHKITRTQLTKFTEALQSLKTQKNVKGQALLSLQKSTLENQIIDLQRELDEYDDLVSGNIPISELNSIDELSVTLIKARIALGLSQKQLGEMVGLPEQQIQRYESNEYESTSLSRIKEIADALNLKIDEHITIQPNIFSPKKLFKKMNSVGISPDFILKKILPPRLSAKFENDETISDLLGLEASHHIGKVFGIKPGSIFKSAPLVFDTSPLAKVRYKMAKNTNKRKLHAHAIYAHYIALLVSQATKHKPKKKIPDNPSVIRKDIIAEYGEITFEAILRYIWNLGIPVLVLDSMSFHAACFKDKDRNIIVLTQKTDYDARWMFDLLYELYHASQSTGDTVEGETQLRDNKNKAERIASEFADYVLLGTDPHELVKCLEVSDWSAPQIKKNMQKITKEKNIRKDVLADHIAFGMSSGQKQTFWQTSSLQKQSADAREMICDQLIENLDFGTLTESDFDLLRPILFKQEAVMNG